MLKPLVTILTFIFTLTNILGQVSLDLDYQKNFATMVLSPEEYDSWIENDGFSKGQLTGMTQRIYNRFNDDFDFIFFISNEKNVPASINYYGMFVSASNTIGGIGLSTFDNTSAYGSSGKLQGIMHLPYRSGLRSGPALHEFMHNWANFALQTGIYDAGTGQPNNNYSGHWGFTGGSTPGQLGGFDQSTLLTNINGDPNRYSVKTFGMNANGGNSRPFNKLELYLMGMIPASEVPEFDLFRNITSVTIVDDRYEFVAGTRETYTSERLVSELGPRNPDHTNSQKDFKVLFVSLSKAPLTESEWDEIKSNINWFSSNTNDSHSLYNFYEATEGKGTINISNLASSLKPESNTITVLSPDNGHTLKVGEATTIRWQTSIAGNIKIELIQDGKFSHTISSGTAASASSFSWTPDISLLGENYRIKITSIAEPQVNDFSDNAFIIDRQYFRLSGTVTDENNAPVANTMLLLGDPLIRDQIQEEGLSYSPIDNNRKEQSFRPGTNSIGRVDLHVYRSDVNSGNIIVEIADNTGKILGRDTIRNNEISGNYAVASAAFIPSVTVVADSTYLLKVSSDGEGFFWGVSNTNPYERGQSNLGSSLDYMFITYTGNGAELKTDANGHYQITLGAGYSGQIRLQNFNTLYETSSPIPIVNISENMPEQNFTLRGPVVVSGYVLSAASTPLGSATVSWGEPVTTDQSQTTYLLGYDISYNTLAQTFTPTASSLSQVQLLLTKSPTASQPATVTIKQGETIIGMQNLTEGSFSKFTNWVSAPFIPALTLTPGMEYTIEVSAPSGNTYYWYGDIDQYENGTASGISRQNFDFCFKTDYGTGGSFYTDTSGFYQFRYPSGWSGEIKAEKTGYMFYNKLFSALTSSLGNQNFIEDVVSSIYDIRSSIADINVYPNPATENVSFELLPDEHIQNIEVISEDGLFTETYSGSLENLRQHITISALHRGWYILKITTSKRTYTTKLNKL